MNSNHKHSGFEAPLLNLNRPQIRLNGEMNMRLLKSAIVSSLGVATLFGAASLTSAQNVNREYRQYQRAAQEAQRECIDYQRSGSRSDYRQCQQAQARAQRELMDYQRSSSSYNNGYYNNNRTSTVYNPRTGQTYRVYNNGRYYSYDQRGVNLLRQAVNSGYQQGYQQGQMDRRYGRGMNYYGNNVYSNGMFGYESYVARDQYQYYFQQGFQKGYEDGYYSTNRYGYRSGSSFNILSGVLNTILNLASQ
jgi:hypothetical protein